MLFPKATLGLLALITILYGAAAHAGYSCNVCHRKISGGDYWYDVFFNESFHSTEPSGTRGYVTPGRCEAGRSADTRCRVLQYEEEASAGRISSFSNEYQNSGFAH